MHEGTNGGGEVQVTSKKPVVNKVHDTGSVIRKNAQ